MNTIRSKQQKDAECFFLSSPFSHDEFYNPSSLPGSSCKSYKCSQWPSRRGFNELGRGVTDAGTQECEKIEVM